MKQHQYTIISDAHTGLLTDGLKNRNLNLDLFMFYSCDNISIAKFLKLIKNGTVGGNIL